MYGLRKRIRVCARTHSRYHVKNDTDYTAQASQDRHTYAVRHHHLGGRFLLRSMPHEVKGNILAPRDLCHHVTTKDTTAKAAWGNNILTSPSPKAMVLATTIYHLDMTTLSHQYHKTRRLQAVTTIAVCALDILGVTLTFAQLQRETKPGAGNVTRYTLTYFNAGMLDT